MTSPSTASTDLSLSATVGDGAVTGPAREVSYTDTGRPGEYELVEIGADGNEIASGRFVVNAGHVTESDLRVNLDLPSLLTLSGGVDRGSTRSSLFDLWPAVVAFALGLLALEWIVAVFPRRTNRRAFAPSALPR